MRFFEMKRVPARAAKEKAVRKDCGRNTARQAFAMGSNPMHSTQQAFGSALSGRADQNLTVMPEYSDFSAQLLLFTPEV